MNNFELNEKAVELEDKHTKHELARILAKLIGKGG